MTTSKPTMALAELTEMQDFPFWTRPISWFRTHLAGATGGAVGVDVYASFFLAASLRALTPR